MTFANLVPGKKPATLEGDKDRVPKTVPGHSGNAQLLVGDSHIDLGNKTGLFERNDPFSLSLWFRIERAGVMGPLVTRGADLFNGNRGYEIFIHKDGTLTAGLHHVFPDNSIEIATQPLKPGVVVSPRADVRRIEPCGGTPPIPQRPGRAHNGRHRSPAAKHHCQRRPEEQILGGLPWASHRPETRRNAGGRDGR